MTGRDAGGRFAPGYAPDRGRGPAPASPAPTADLRAAVLAVANTAVTMSIDGQRRTVSLFEASLWRLASGQTTRRTSPTAFIRLVLECAPAEAPAEEEPAPSFGDTLFEAMTGFDRAVKAGSEKEIEEALVAFTRLRRRFSRTAP